MKPTLLLPGAHQGFSKLKSKPGVFRCKLRAVASKAKPEFADYSGTLFLAGGAKAGVLLWSHQDGSLGLRFEMLKP